LERDYLGKQIDELGAVLAKILTGLLGLQSEGKCNQATVDAILKDELGFDVSQITNIPETDFIDWLQSKNFTTVHFEKLADILLLTAETTEGQSLYRKSLLLLDYLEKDDKTFSIVRHQKITQIRSSLGIEGITDNGPFYHGTRADLKIGDLLTSGFGSNYHPDVIMNHIYFTALPNGAGLAAALAKGDGHQRVYIVEPIGSFENDPNVTDKKFPGNPTRSYRSAAPLKIVGELEDWIRQTPEEIQKWRGILADAKGEIIN
jgi:hypothetical protein